MNKYFRNFLLSIFFLIAAYDLSAGRSRKKWEYVPGEVLVRYKHGISVRAGMTVPGRAGYTVKRSFYPFRNTTSGVHLLKIQKRSTVAEAINELKKDPSISHVQPNYIYKMFAASIMPNDANFGDLWGLNNTGQSVNSIFGTADADIDAPEAWGLSKGSYSVIVAVLDTGVALTHPDIQANLWTNIKEIPGNGLDDDGNGYKDDINGWDFFDDDADPTGIDTHGTHVAGIIGAASDNSTGITGVCWNTAEIMALKISGVEQFTTTENIIKAIDYAVSNGAKVINASWGGGAYNDAAGDILRDAIEDAGKAGVLFVAAAGNDGDNSDSSPMYPAAYSLDCILSVGATNQDDDLSDFSNYGIRSVDVCAPGSNIYSSIPVYKVDSTATLYSTNFDTFTVGFLPTADWGSIGGSKNKWVVSNVESNSPSNALNDSPSSNYASNLDSSEVNLWCKTKVQYLKDSKYYLNFYAKYDFENDSDYLDIICSEDASSWEFFDFLTGTSSGFEKKEINVTSVMEYFKKEGAYFGFGIDSDDNVQAEGAIIDDFSIDRYGLALDQLTYEYYDGTSMAAPCVAGLAALMLSVKPDLSVSTLKSRILASVDKKANLSDRVLSGGRINAYNALDKIINNNSPTFGWVGVSNYVSDGIHPNSGGIATQFSYRVKYSDSDNDNPKSGYPLLHVLKAGAEIPGSPFQMKDTAISDTDYSDEKIYEYSLTLSSGTDYSYFFEAYDVLGATASGTGILLGPDVGLVSVVPGQAKILGGAKGYVNPIHGEEAKIIFFSPTSGTVDIKIYTLNGQLVWEKKELVLPDQQNTVAWACRNIDGNVVASGIYLVHIKGAGMDIKKKIAILK